METNKEIKIAAIIIIVYASATAYNTVRSTINTIVNSSQLIIESSADE